MSNYILLCHGVIISNGLTVRVPKGCEVRYRGDYESNLTEIAAKKLVNALLGNMALTDEQIKRGLPDYGGTRVTTALSQAPDFFLAGNDTLSCFMMNLDQKSITCLNSDWKTSLKEVVQKLNLNGNWSLDLLCCRTLGPRMEIPPLKEMKKKENWEQVLG